MNSRLDPTAGNADPLTHSLEQAAASFTPPAPFHHAVGFNPPEGAAPDDVVERGGRAHRLRRLFLELVGYGLASAAALALDVGLLKILVDHAGWHYLPSSIVSFVSGAGVAYYLSVRLVFSSRVFSNATAEFAVFLALGLAGLLVNSIVIAIAISGVGLGLVTAKLIAAVCAFTANFALRRKLLFSAGNV